MTIRFITRKLENKRLFTPNNILSTIFKLVEDDQKRETDQLKKNLDNDTN